MNPNYDPSLPVNLFYCFTCNEQFYNQDNGHWKPHPGDHNFRYQGEMHKEDARIMLDNN